MEVALVIAMFVCTALALDMMVTGKYKLAGTFEVINLCLVVATAYQFALVDSIIVVLGILAVLVVVGLIVVRQIKKRKSVHKVIDAQIVNKGEK